MRWVSSALRFLAWLGTVLAAKALMILLIAAISLSLSLTSFAVPALASAMSGATKWVFGSTAVVTATEASDLRRTNQNLDQRNSDIRKRNQRLASTNKKLERQLTGHRRITANTARRVGQRAVRTTTRSLAAIPIESVPLIGISTIIATTAWEIRDTCRTLDDMAEIQKQLGQEPDPGFAEKVCDTFAIQGARVDYYGDMTVSECRAQAKVSRDRILELAAQSNDEIPDLIDDMDRWNEETAQAANEEFKEINAICDCIADLICDPDDLSPP